MGLSIAEEAVIKLGVFTQVDLVRELKKVALVVAELEITLNDRVTLEGLKVELDIEGVPAIIVLVLPLLKEVKSDRTYEERGVASRVTRVTTVIGSKGRTRA